MDGLGNDIDQNEANIILPTDVLSDLLNISFSRDEDWEDFFMAGGFGGVGAEVELELEGIKVCIHQFEREIELNN